MSKPKAQHVRLLTDMQYPPHPAPQPAGAVVDDYPPSAVADDLAQGWVELTDDPVTEPAYVEYAPAHKSKAPITLADPATGEGAQ